MRTRTWQLIKLVQAVAVQKSSRCLLRWTKQYKRGGCVAVPGLSCGMTTCFPFDSGEAMHPPVHGLFGLAASLLSGGQAS